MSKYGYILAEKGRFERLQNEHYKGEAIKLLFCWVKTGVVELNEFKRIMERLIK